MLSFVSGGCLDCQFYYETVIVDEVLPSWKKDWEWMKVKRPNGNQVTLVSEQRIYATVKDV